MKKFFIIICIFIISFLFSGCYSVEISTNPTDKGYIEYVNSAKRIKKENRQYKRYETKRRNKVYKKQKQPFYDTFKN